MKHIIIDSTFLNSNFKVVVETSSNRTLVGFKGLSDVIGDDDLRDRLIIRSYLSGHDKFRCKLRRGLIIDFYSF